MRRRQAYVVIGDATPEVLVLAKRERPAPIAAVTRPGLDPWPYITVAALVATNVLLLTGERVAFLGAVLGWWLIMVHPVYLLTTTRVANTVSGAERVAYGLVTIVGVLLVGGLLLNSVLPLVGVARPLDRVPVLIFADVVNVGLFSLRLHRGAIGRGWGARVRLLNPRECRILIVAATCIPVVVAGANRLNNGAGGGVALVGLAAIGVGALLLLWWRTDLRDSVISATIYLLGLSLLLATSLRGWYVTGHDIQREYRVFELTKDSGVWHISSFRDAYNACLSITILPTEIWQVVRVDDPYIYKVFFQVLFAFCPVLVYTLARRYWSKQVAILGVVYFVGFPTFFTDMPFLNRQEIAFLFVGVAFLVLTKDTWTTRRRRLLLLLCGVAMCLSHYSTTYMFVGTIAVAVIVGWLRIPTRVRAGRHRQSGRAPVPDRPWADMARVLSIGTIVGIALVAFAWGGLITHTSTGIGATVEDALPQVFGTPGGSHSADSSYSLFGSKQQTAAQLLDEYRAQTLEARLKDDPGTYLPLSEAEAYPTPVVAQPSLPPTGLGRDLADAHLPPATINDLVRGVAAKGEQVFLVVGLLIFLFLRKRRRQVGREVYFLSLGSVAFVVAVTVLPGLSVSYGVLRAFLQALIVVAPLLVIGSFAVFRPLGPKWAPRAAMSLALVLFVSTIGIMPQVLGSYPAQLGLNNSGYYYNEYYLHPQEISAIQWLGGEPGTLPAGVQAENITDRYTFKSPGQISGSQLITDLYPTLVRKSTWVLLGYYTVHTGDVGALYDGDLITYRYPVALLDRTKDLVYNNGGTVIYK